MTTYETKDSGTHLEYDSGMRRDSQDGKPRFDLIRTRLQPYEEQMIYRYAMLLARGAEKYSARNWEEGCGEEELERAKASLLRHTEQLVAGETDEDHAAAVWFNSQAIEYFRWRLNSHQPQTDEEALAAERAKRASEINNLALQKAAQIRRRERLLASAKEFDAELTEDAQELARQADAELDHKLVHGDLTVEAEDVPLDTVVAAYDGSKSGAVGLYQFIPGDWAERQLSLGQQIADNIRRRYAMPQRWIAGIPAVVDSYHEQDLDSHPDAN